MKILILLLSLINCVYSISNCEELIKKYLHRSDSIKEKSFNIDNISIYDENYKNKIFEICKNDLVNWYIRKIKNSNFNIENPKSYNEKIQWMKLYDNSPLKTQLTDKYLVRNWIKEKIGEKYLIPLYGVWDSFDEINFDLLPEKFVLKTNHGCGFNIIVKNKSELNIEKIKEKINKWMKINYALKYFEFQYLNIEPKIIAEKYIENFDGDVYDYKVFCFNGKAESIMFLRDRKRKLKMSFYDLNWNKLNYTYTYQMDDTTIPKPKNLELLVELAEKLAEGFPHVRVDFYILNDGSIKFGEMTFSTMSGVCKWNPEKINKYFGDLIKLPPKKVFPL